MSQRRRYRLTRNRVISSGIEKKTITETFNLLDAFTLVVGGGEPDLVFNQINESQLSTLTNQQYSTRVNAFLRKYVEEPGDRSTLQQQSQFESELVVQL